MYKYIYVYVDIYIHIPIYWLYPPGFDVIKMSYAYWRYTVYFSFAFHIIPYEYYIHMVYPIKPYTVRYIPIVSLSLAPMHPH